MFEELLEKFEKAHELCVQYECHNNDIDTRDDEMIPPDEMSALHATELEASAALLSHVQALRDENQRLEREVKRLVVAKGGPWQICRACGHEPHFDVVCRGYLCDCRDDTMTWSDKPPLSGAHP